MNFFYSNSQSHEVFLENTHSNCQRERERANKNMWTFWLLKLLWFTNGKDPKQTKKNDSRNNFKWSYKRYILIRGIDAHGRNNNFSMMILYKTEFMIENNKKNWMTRVSTAAIWMAEIIALLFICPCFFFTIVVEQKWLTDEKRKW